MTRIYFTCWRIAVAFAIRTAVAQQCYYPNGADAPEKACSSAQGSACCPDKWECLDNGLCYYPPDNLHGRYSCTDKSWKAEGCPSNMCTYDLSAAGGESITQCSDHNNDWCCNADAQNVNCCKESPAPRPFFALADGKAYATVGASTASSAPNLATITGKALESEATGTASPSSSGSGSNSPQSTDAPNTAPSPSVNAEPTTQLQTSLSSGTAGIRTVIRTVVSAPSATSSSSDAAPSNSSQSSSKIPIIVGCAVGIPLFLALVGIIFWLLRKRSKQAKFGHRQSKPPYADEILTDAGTPENRHGYGFAGGATHNHDAHPNKKPPLTTYKSTGDVPELAGNSLDPTAPVSAINGRAELDSGAALLPVGATASANGHSPHSSWGSSAPGAARPISEMDGMGVVGSNQNQNQNHAPPGGYIPYRPHNIVQPHQAQEMSSVTTPP